MVTPMLTINYARQANYFSLYYKHQKLGSEM